MGSAYSAHKEKKAAMTSQSKDKINDLVSKHKVMVFSKSYCPFCKKAKSALSQYTDDFEVLELENAPDCDAMQVRMPGSCGNLVVSGAYARVSRFMLASYRVQRSQPTAQVFTKLLG